MASFKGASIADNMEQSNGIIQWNIQFSRLVHDWEVEVLASFYKCLYDCKLRGVGVDKLWWLHSHKECLRSSPFIEHFRLQGLFRSLGRAFGDLRLPLEWHFLLGQLLMARFLL
jgi:hypothetical protein